MRNAKWGNDSGRKVSGNDCRRSPGKRGAVWNLAAYSCADSAFCIEDAVVSYLRTFGRSVSQVIH
jgi:hypothetical protein